jgi:hypothetical protein
VYTPFFHPFRPNSVAGSRVNDVSIINKRHGKGSLSNPPRLKNPTKAKEEQMATSWKVASEYSKEDDELLDGNERAEQEQDRQVDC